MRALVVSACLATSIASADAVWAFPFTELGANWTVQSPWVLDSTGGHYGPQVEAGTDWIYKTMSSGTLSFPEQLDSVRIDMWSGYDYYGWAMDGGSEISIEATLDTGPEPMAFIDIEDGYEGWSSGSYSGSDSSAVSVTFPAEPGQPLTLSFIAGKDGYGYIYGSDLYWVLWDMTITGYGEYEGLASCTWAEIKSCF